jgi:hypothetical protein
MRENDHDGKITNQVTSRSIPPKILFLDNARRMTEERNGGIEQ